MRLPISDVYFYRAVLIATAVIALTSTGSGAIAQYDPLEDVNSGWTACTDCTGEQYTLLDDGIRQPTTPDTSDYIYSDKKNRISTSGYTDTINTRENIKSITAWVYTKTQTDSEYSFELQQGGTAVCNTAVSESTTGWKQCSWNSPSGDFSLLTTNYGSCGTASGQGNPTECRIDAVYLAVEYNEPPAVSYIEPTPADEAVSDQAYTVINTSVTDDYGVTSCDLEFDQTNTSMTVIDDGTDAYCYANMTGLDEGQHAYSVYATDSDGATTRSMEQSITIDTKAPSVTLQSPADGVQNLDRSLTFNASFNDMTTPPGPQCSLTLDGSVNQTVSSVQNDTYVGFTVDGIAEGSHTWNVSCTDQAGNIGVSNTWGFEAEYRPTIDSISASPDPIKGGDNIDIIADTVNDPNSDQLQLFCSEATSAATDANTYCTGGNTLETDPYDGMDCSYQTETDSSTHTTYCRVYDGEYYSDPVSTSYTTDVTPPDTSTVSVDGDDQTPYYDTSDDDGVTTITVDGETGMTCRWSSSDVSYDAMSASNDCTTDSDRATCDIDDIPSEGGYTRHIACADSLENGQNESQNEDVGFILDHTVPMTDDTATSGIKEPPYEVTIQEQDNVDGDPETLYCMDQQDTCQPDSEIDDGQSLTFYGSDRGRNYLRYRSTDNAGNQQPIQSSTIDINQRPLLDDVTDNVTIVGPDRPVEVSTTASDPDGQDVTMTVCENKGFDGSSCTAGPELCTATASDDPACEFSSAQTDGIHTWYVYLTDVLGENATDHPKMGSYEVDATTPTITIEDPQNTTYTQRNVPAQIDLDEAGDTAQYRLVSGPNTTVGNQSMNQLSSQSFATTLSDLEPGTHGIRFFADDVYGNTGASDIRYFSVSTDTTAPSISVDTPANQSSIADDTFFLNISTDEQINAASYTVNEGLNQSMSQSSTQDWYGQVETTDGDKQITVYAEDDAGNIGSRYITVTVDTSAPVVQQKTVDPDTAAETEDVACSAYWTEENELDRGFVAENSSGTFVNHSISLSGSAGWTNHTIGSDDIAVGSYSCRFYARDVAGNTASVTSAFRVTDQQPPALTATFPENKTYTSNDVPVSLSSDEVADRAWYAIDQQQNITFSGTDQTSFSTSLSPGDGQYQLRLYANDTAGNIGTVSPRTFTIDTTEPDTEPPSVSIVQPMNTSFITTDTPMINISTDEALQTATYSLDGGSWTELSNTSQRDWGTELTSLTDGDHTVLYNVTDLAGNFQTVTHRFTVDTTAPTISNTQASPNPAPEGDDVTCNADLEDTTSELQRAWIGEDAAGGFVNHSISVSGATETITYTTPGDDLETGSFTCRFWAQDQAGSWTSHDTGFDVTDQTPPSMTVSFPENRTYTNRDVSVSVGTDEAVRFVNYTLNSGTMTMLSNSSATAWSGTLTGLANQQHNLTLYAEDDAGNTAMTSVFFTVDTTLNDETPPTLFVNNPDNNSFYSDPVILNISATESLSNAVFRLDDGQNQSLTEQSPTQWETSSGITLTEGEHAVRFFANDSSTNRNTGSTGSVFFTYDASQPQAGTISTTAPMNDSTSLTCGIDWSDAVGLDEAIIGHNASGQFQNHTIEMDGTTDSVNRTIDASAIDPGLVVCRFYGVDTTGNIASTQKTVLVDDVTPPAITDLSPVPESEAELDPGVAVTVSASVTDTGTVNTTWLQYRSGTGSYTNTTMTTTGNDRYEGTVTLQDAGYYDVRVFANDSAGNQNISDALNLSVFNDTTFSVNHTVPATRSRGPDGGSNMSLGAVTINNTGDEMLSFNMSADRSIIRFNTTDQQSWSKTVDRDYNTTTVDVFAATRNLPAGTYPFTITISGSQEGTLIRNETISGEVIIQQKDGPLMRIDVREFSSNVDSGDTGIRYKAVAENIGTESATRGWLRWSLPEVFSLRSGMMNRSSEPLIIGESVSNTISIDIDEVDDQNVTLSAIAGVTDGVGVRDERTVTIGQPAVETIVEGGGGTTVVEQEPSTGTEQEILQGERTLSASRRIDLVRGQNTSFPLAVQNIFENTTLGNVTLRMDGIPRSQLTVTPTELDGIKYQQNASFLINITSPAYLEQGRRSLTLVVTGDISGPFINQTLTDRREITLVTHTISQEDANQSINEADDAIASMNDKGFRTSSLEQRVQEARDALQDREYDQAASLVEDIRAIRQRAEETRTTLQRVRDRMAGERTDTGRRLGYTRPFPETEELLRLAQAAADREDYQTALQRAQDAELVFESERQHFRPLFSLFEYWQELLIVIIIGFITGIVGYRRYQKFVITRRIRDLNAEEQHILDSIKDLQHQYYQEGAIGSQTFNNEIDDFEEELASVRQQRTTYRHKRIKLLDPSAARDALRTERETVMEKLQLLQEQYYEDDTISKHRFERHADVYHERLAEIEEEQIELELQEVLE